MFPKRRGIRITLLSMATILYSSCILLYLFFAIVTMGIRDSLDLKIAGILIPVGMMQFISSFMILGWSKFGVRMYYFSWVLLGALPYFFGLIHFSEFLFTIFVPIVISHLLVFLPKWQDFE